MDVADVVEECGVRCWEIICGCGNHDLKNNVVYGMKHDGLKRSMEYNV